MHQMTRKKLASLIWPRFSPSLEVLNRNSQMFSTIRAYDDGSVKKYQNRAQMYSGVNEILRNTAISYLEFGVWKGESLEWWMNINTDACSRFYGFDSFEGLPEAWDHGFGRSTNKEQFDLGGIMPHFVDTRVRLVKGWFQHTLRLFLQENDLPHPIVVHIDGDLHSSALYILCMLDTILTSGDIVMFDEYTSPSHEYLAWEEYKSAFMREATCIAMANRWCQTTFMMK